MAGLDVSPPQTELGKLTEAGASMVPGALAFGPTNSLRGMVGTAVRQGIIPGVASEVAGQATEGTPAEPYVRAGTAILTGQPLPSIGRAPNKMLGDVLKDVTWRP